MDLRATLAAARRPTGETHAVGVAYEAFSHFGDDLTRRQAAVLLETWQWQPPLSQREHETLLMRFSR